MIPLESLIFRKAKKLIKLKKSRIRDFQNMLLEKEFMGFVYAMDQKEEEIHDAAIFRDDQHFQDFKEYIFNELKELDDEKNKILSCCQYKYMEYGGLSKEEAVKELQNFLDDTKIIAAEYFENFKITIDHFQKKLYVIEHIQIVDKKFQKAKVKHLNMLKNLKNLENLITVDNVHNFLFDFIQKLENFSEELFQNILKIFDKLEEVKMYPCINQVVDDRCPSSSENSSCSSDEILTDDESANNENKSQKSSDCFFEDQSLGVTRMDSIEKLKTDENQLDEQIESIREEKAQIKQKILEKKKGILELLAKVAEFEDNIQEVEVLIGEKLYNFQHRLLNLETKLNENFRGENDEDLKNLLENEICELKEDFSDQSEKDEDDLCELIQHGHVFAKSIGCIIDDITKLFNPEEINENTKENLTKLRKLLQRPAKYCYDSKGRRFYLNQEKNKVFQDEHHTELYIIDSEEEKIIVKEGFPLEIDENGEYYTNVKGLKIYTKYYFEDNFGQYFIDVHGDRHYKSDSEASEYMLVNGAWIKTKEGTYERDEKGMRVKPAMEDPPVDAESDLDQIFDYLQSDSIGISAGHKNKISKEDLKYIKETVGPAIIKACAATYLHMPSDPLNYFANYLLHYRYTQKMFEARDSEQNYFTELRKQMENNHNEC